MQRVVIASEIQPGDVYLSAVDGKPHWVDEVIPSRFRQAGWLPQSSTDEIGPCLCGPVDDPVLILVCEGERRIPVHHLSLPVLVNRPECAA